MAKKNLLNKLRDRVQGLTELDFLSSPANLCLASTDGNGAGPTYYRLNVTDNVTSEFRQIAASAARKQSKNLTNGNFAVRPYNAISKLDSHEIEHIDLSKHPFIRQQIEGLADLRSVVAFTKLEDVQGALRFYVIAIEPNGSEPVYFFRSCSPKMDLRRSSKIALIFSGGHYDTFNESLFVFDRGIDCFSCGDDLFVLNKGQFETIFQFFEEVRAAASETLETIRAVIPIHNFEDLEAACLGHIQMLKKLKNIAAQPYLSRIKMGDIKNVIKEMGLSLTIQRHDGTEKLSFDSKDKWEILRLLDDDYLKSIMTGEKYEVNSKRTL